MKISCQSCHSKYNVADEKVQGKIVKIRCRKCGATIVVNASGGASRNGSAPAPPAIEAAEGEWHVSVSDNDQRTMTLAQLVSAYNSGIVGQDTFVWTEGMADWKALADVEAVVSALHAAAAPVPAASAPPAAQAQERRTSPPAAAAPPAAHAGPPVYEPPQVASSFERPPTGGAFDPQSPAPPVETKRAAVKREARAKDLFATRTGEELQMSTPSAEDDARLTGQRNENSVLFSLEHLSKNTDQPRSFASQSFGGNKDDSGLIDLKALAAKAESMRPPAMHDAQPSAPLGVAPPLGFAAPLGGLATAADAQPKSRLPLLIGGGAGVALLLVLGIVIGLKIGGAAAPAPVASAGAFALPPLPTASVEAPAPSAPASAAAAQPSASAFATPVVAAKPRPVAPPGGGVFKPGVAAGVAPKPPGAGVAAGGATSPAGAAAPAAPAAAAPAKKGDCGCNGDLMCMMKCSTH